MNLLPNSRTPSNAGNRSFGFGRSYLHNRHDARDEESHGIASSPSRPQAPFKGIPVAKKAQHGKLINVNIDNIVKITSEHENFSVPESGYGVVDDLPEFDELGSYGIEASNQKTIFRLEIERLTKTLGDLSTVPDLVGENSLSIDSKDSYDSIARLADAMWSGLNLCGHDTESIFLEHYLELHNEKRFELNKEVLERLTAAGASESVFKTRQQLLKANYFLQAFRYQTLIHSIFRFLGLSLRGTKRAIATPKSCFELCSMVYETGFTGFPTLILQDRDEDFLATSDEEIVNVSYSVYNILRCSIDRIKQARFEGRSVKDISMSTPTTLTWDYRVANESATVDKTNSENESSTETEEERMNLHTLNEVLMVLVPLELTSPAATALLYADIRALIFTSSETERLNTPMVTYENKKYKAFFCLTTEEYELASTVRKSLGVTSLSKALMTRDKLLAGRTIGEISYGSTLPLLKQSQDQKELIRQQSEQILRNHEGIARAHEEMKSWVVEEKGIMVDYRWYVLSVASLCLELVLGGIAIGVTVHNRIPGVDPFGVTTYCWVLAALVLLVAKSVRVENWTWRDFLRRRVFCKSVSELHAVTGIDEQLILAKLLHDESTAILRTRGPFNCLFNRIADDGFSIDKPASMWTMLLSGLIMMQA